MAWDEVAVLRFDDVGRVRDMWFMCQELGLAEQLGYSLRLG
ncbi:hypothetical protein ABZX85_17190 [Streptomyces sp. NPDC004539]